MTSPTLSGERPRPARVRPSTARPALAGAWLLPALLSCGEERERPPPLGTGRAIPGCEAFAYRPCDILSAACQSELFALTACVYGERDPGAPPPVARLDEAQALALIYDGSGAPSMTDGIDAMRDSAADEARFRAQVRGLELVGLLDPGTIATPGDVADATIGGLLAYYLISARRIVVIDRGAPVDDLESNIVLAHEFVHALQDRRHDLASFEAELTLDSDGALARASLIEGEASLYHFLIEFAYRGADIRSVNLGAFFDQLTALALDITLEAGSPALTADSIFPYTFGARYAGELWRAGGSAGLDAAYDAPPRTTWQVMGGSSALPLAAFAQAPAPLDGYAAVADDVAGAWVSVAMLAGLAQASEFVTEWPRLAAGWRGDHLWVFDSPDAGVATLWALEWESAETASRFAELAAALAPAGATVRIDTLDASTRITAVERAEDLEAWRARGAEVVP